MDGDPDLAGTGRARLERLQPQLPGPPQLAPQEVGADPGSLRIDGRPLSAPYDIRAVGPTAAMEVALNVAGGVVADVSRVGGGSN